MTLALPQKVVLEIPKQVCTTIHLPINNNNGVNQTHNISVFHNTGCCPAENPNRITTEYSNPGNEQVKFISTKKFICLQRSKQN